MKVLFITRKFPPSVGGMETLSKGLADRLPDIADPILLTYGGHQLWLPFVVVWFWIRSLFLVRKVDVVLLGDAVLSPLGWWIKTVHKKPVSCVLHGLDIRYPAKIYQWYLRLFSKHLDLYICNSRATEEEAKRRGYSPTTVILPAIEDADAISTREARRLLAPLIRTRPPKDAFVLGFLGRDSKRKGLSWFLQNVFPKLPSHVHLMIAGSTPMEEIVSNISSPSDLSRIHVLGRIEDDQRLLFFSSLDLFIMPNISVAGDQEGFGIVAIEASAHGTPVLAADLEGIRDAVIEGKTGFLATSEDPDAFQETISYLSGQDNKEYAAVSASAQQATRDLYSWKNRILEYKKELSRIA